MANKKQLIILGPFIGFPHKFDTIHFYEIYAGFFEKVGVPLSIKRDLTVMQEEPLRKVRASVTTRGRANIGYWQKA